MTPKRRPHTGQAVTAAMRTLEFEVGQVVTIVGRRGQWRVHGFGADGCREPVWRHRRARKMAGSHARESSGGEMTPRTWDLDETEEIMRQWSKSRDLTPRYLGENGLTLCAYIRELEAELAELAP